MNQQTITKVTLRWQKLKWLLRERHGWYGEGGQHKEGGLEDSSRILEVGMVNLINREALKYIPEFLQHCKLMMNPFAKEEK